MMTRILLLFVLLVLLLLANAVTLASPDLAPSGLYRSHDAGQHWLLLGPAPPTRSRLCPRQPIPPTTPCSCWSIPWSRPDAACCAPAMPARPGR
jgi:hypothetical protein